jgi:hypothetical protein
VKLTMAASYRRKTRYGITQEQMEAVLLEQGGLCALCHKRPPVDVDHDHETGDFRGLLCRACNLGIGMFGDDPAKLRAAIDYLEREKTGVAAQVRRPGKPTPQRGERHHRAKVTEQTVRAIRAEYAEGRISYPKLAAKYRLHREHIAQIVRRQKWSHI